MSALYRTQSDLKLLLLGTIPPEKALPRQKLNLKRARTLHPALIILKIATLKLNGERAFIVFQKLKFVIMLVSLIVMSH